MLASCHRKKETWTIITNHEIGSAINDLIPNLRVASEAMDDLEIKFHEELGSSQIEVTKMLVNGEVDLAILSNSTQWNEAYADFRTVMPLFPDYLIILADTSFKGTSIQNMPKDQKIGAMVRNREDSLLFDAIFSELGINQKAISGFIETESAVDDIIEEQMILFTFVSLKNTTVDSLMDLGNLKLLSIDKLGSLQKGSLAQTICTKNPRLRPFVIPKHLFATSPTMPLLTISVSDLLVGRKDLNEQLVHDFNQSVFKQKIFLAQNYFEFGQLEESFYQQNLIFPLHSGAMRYYHRDEPSFLERNGRTIGLGVSGIVLIVGLITSFKIQRRYLRTGHVDQHMQQVHAINLRLKEEELNEADILALKHQLDEVLNEAVNKLTSEKLDPDASFKIFSQLVSSTNERIHHALTELQKSHG